MQEPTPATYDELHALLKDVTEAVSQIRQAFLDAREDAPTVDWAPLITQADSFAEALEDFVLPDEEDVMGERADPGPLHFLVYEAVSRIIEDVTGEKRAFNLTIEMHPNQLH